MAQRRIEVLIPREYEKEALSLMSSLKPIAFWKQSMDEEMSVIYGLIEAEDSDHAIDLFESTYAIIDDFHIILLSVEASVPRAEPVSEEPDDIKSVGENRKKPGQQRISREELYMDVIDGARLSNVFVVMTILSTMVVAVGLIKANVAIIIGGMVIAPFLGPNVALAMSTNLADKELGLEAIKTLIAGVSTVVVLSLIMGFLLDVDPNSHEILSRTRPDFSDIILALASGSAGVLAFTTGASSAIIGVMVAVALLPPLVTSGLLIGSGYYHPAFGAFLLFIINIICVNLAGVFTFLVRGVSPSAWWESGKAKKYTRYALILWSLTLIGLALVVYISSKNY